EAAANKIAGLRREAEREDSDKGRFAAPPPPRPAAPRDRAVATDRLDDLLEGASSGAERQKEEASGAGAGVGHLGGPGVATRSQPALDEKKPVEGQRRRAPSPALAKAPAAAGPAAMEPPPAAAPAPPPATQRANPGYLDEAPVAASASAPR